jgi:hypothetical protein
MTSSTQPATNRVGLAQCYLLGLLGGSLGLAVVHRLTALLGR